MYWKNSYLSREREKSRLQELESWHTFFRTPNNMFAYAIVHLAFPAPQIVVSACMYANVYLTVHLLQQVEGKFKVYSTHYQPKT